MTNEAYEIEKLRTQREGWRWPPLEYITTDWDTYVSNPFWDGVKHFDFEAIEFPPEVDELAHVANDQPKPVDQPNDDYPF